MRGIVILILMVVVLGSAGMVLADEGVSYTTYVSQTGDTIASISLDASYDLDLIRVLNPALKNFSDRDVLPVGTKIQLPGSAVARLNHSRTVSSRGWKQELNGSFTGMPASFWLVLGAVAAFVLFSSAVTALRH